MALPAPVPRSVLCLDVGRRRIGLAGCDPLGISVRPLQAIRRGPFAQDLKTIRRLCAERRVGALVVGLPLDQRGQPTEQAKHCERYGRRLAEALALPIAWVNEHSSSWAAAEQRNLHGDRSGRLDSEAASLLLEQWLREGPEPEPVKASAPRHGMGTDDAGS